MTARSDADYYAQREAQERMAAEQASCMARTAHLEMAEHFAELRQHSEQSLQIADEDKLLSSGIGIVVARSD